MTECRLVSITLTGDREAIALFVHLEDGIRQPRIRLSWEEFQQVAAAGAVIFGTDNDRTQARFSHHSYAKIIVIARDVREMLTECSLIGVKTFNRSWVF